MRVPTACLPLALATLAACGNATTRAPRAALSAPATSEPAPAARDATTRPTTITEQRAVAPAPRSGDGGAATLACGPGTAAALDPGCDGPPRFHCDSGQSLPSTSTWCGCDGRDVQSPSAGPPQGTRYRFAGPCAVTADLRVQPEPGASGAPTGRQIVWFTAGASEQEAGRFAGTCAREPAPRAPDLVVVRCRAGRAAPVVLAVRRDAGELVAYRDNAPVARTPVPLEATVRPR